MDVGRLMAKRRQRFIRPLGERRYRKLFLVAVEGIRTEPEYFALLNEGHAVVKIECISGKGSSPPEVLARLKTGIEKTGLIEGDEAWLVVDKDSWTDQQLMPLFQWSVQGTGRGFALSNPKFEYWLLLHFEDTGVASSNDCSEKLSHHLPGYNKGINVRAFSIERVNSAIQRAKARDNPPCTDWPRNTGTTVYRLVERIIDARTQP